MLHAFNFYFFVTQIVGNKSKLIFARINLSIAIDVIDDQNINADVDLLISDCH